MNLLTSARSYLKKGLSVIPTDSIKKSVIPWKVYQSRLPTDQELESNFSKPYTKGIAVVCGAVSGNLEVIDIDCKNGISYKAVEDRLKTADPKLYAKLLIICTKSNGYHLYYRCESIDGNLKLARRQPTEDERHENPMIGPLVLIETRGEGGYVIAPPTDGYEWIQGKEIPLINLSERDTIISVMHSFNEVIDIVAQPTIPHNNDSLTVWDDYNKRGDIVALLEKHGWSVVKRESDKILFKRPGNTSAFSSGVLFLESKIFYPHTTSSQFANKGYNGFGVYTLLECNGDWKKAARQLSDTYGQKNEFGWFWSVSDQGKVSISRYELQRWLYTNNFQLYFQNEQNGVYRLIQETDKKVKEIYPEAIKKYIKHRLEKEGHIDVIEVLMRQTKSIFSDSFFEYIEKSNIEILRDEPDTCYFPFLKGIVAVSQQGIKFITYGTINKSIWETQIIDFDIEINHFFIPDDCVFYKFISKICSDDPVRINYAISLIGYILHSYKDPAKPFAVILAEETDDESKGGGTGKGLFFQAIGKLIPVVRIDGKNFKPDKTFAFQRVGLGTRLVVIEDCPKNVDFERYYPTITEGITIEKKNQDEMFLAYSDSPKIAFTTNYTISNNAEHAKRRQRILEFSPFFSSTNTPKDFFGHTLFFDWDHEEWTRFYNFMFYSVKQYLQHDIPNIDNSEKLLRKQIKMQFGEDFLEYYSDLVENYSGKDLSISSEYQNFLKLYELEKKDYSLKRFKKGIQISSKILGFEYQDYINRQSGNTKHFKIIKSIEANPVDGWKAVYGDEIDEIFNL